MLRISNAVSIIVCCVCCGSTDTVDTVQIVNICVNIGRSLVRFQLVSVDFSLT